MGALTQIRLGGNILQQINVLVRDHNRVNRDMIVVVEVIAGRQMRDALTKQGCQLVTMLKTNKGLPNGATASHLEIQLMGSNEHSK